MFTGIVEEIGEIVAISKNTQGLDFDIKAEKIFDDLKIGDSVAINGCCQTVTRIKGNVFTVQAVFETVKLTNFNKLSVGNSVNLERAMQLTSRLGGHIVSGHIEGIASVVSISSQGNATIFELTYPREISKYLIYKGSIAINGISLTICELNSNSFKVSVIPHTLANTTLRSAKVGDEINIETDMIAKYIEKMIIKDDNVGSKITLDFLKENGF